MNLVQIDLERIEAGTTYAMRAYKALKSAITDMDIYGHPGDIRLDERQLCESLGVSRTPIREALTILEREGFVRAVPRKGIVVVRKTKHEIIEMITVWAALESMAVRRATEVATDEEISALDQIFGSFVRRKPEEHVSEYSEANLAFHKELIRLGKCQLINELTDHLFIHMRGIRKVTIGQDNRAQRSLTEHKQIIAALQKRDADLAEKLAREHTLGLAEHVQNHADFLK